MKKSHILKNLMNLKSKFLVILLICLITLVLIPIIFELTGYRETMTDFVNFTDYNTIDRIQKITDPDRPTYSYCMGGTVKCKSTGGSLMDASSNGYTIGKTYKSKCNDDSDVICSDNLFSSVVSYNLPYYTLPGGTSFPLSTTNQGFTSDYGYNITDFDSSNNFNIYNSSKQVLEKIHKCNLLPYYIQQPCYKNFFTSNNNTNLSQIMTSTSNTLSTGNNSSNINSNSSSTLTSNYSETTADTSKCNTSEKIPCLADYGTNVGDNLCCGQTGVLQNTKYVCPITRPKCSNFKCGTQFGNCE